MNLAHPPHPELVLLCGGTEQQRAGFRRAHSAAIDSRTAVTTRDVHSLLRWAPRSRAVIVCGELAGIGVATLQRLVKERAPGVAVMGGDMPLNGNGKPPEQLPETPSYNGAPAVSNGWLALA